VSKNTKKNKKIDYSQMRCPYCGARVELRSSEGIYKTDMNEPQMLWVCTNYPECDAYVRCQKGTTYPLGELADGKLRALRREAHFYFDKLHQDGHISRIDAYKWLSALLCKPVQECHIGSLNDYHCKTVIKKSKEMLELRAKQKKNKKKCGVKSG